MYNIRREKNKQFYLAAKKRREEAEEKLRLEKEELELKASEAYQEEFERNRVDKVRKSKEDVKRFLSAPVSIPKVSKKRLVVPRSPKLGAASGVEKVIRKIYCCTSSKSKSTIGDVCMCACVCKNCSVCILLERFSSGM